MTVSAYRELDARPLGGDAAVHLYAHGQPPSVDFRVEVDIAGEPVARLDGLDREQARETFLHPFADSRVPNIFAEAPA